MTVAAKSRIVAVHSGRSAHTVYFEVNLDTSGYVIINLPVHRWFEMGEPTEIIITIEPGGEE